VGRLSDGITRFCSKEFGGEFRLRKGKVHVAVRTWKAEMAGRLPWFRLRGKRRNNGEPVAPQDMEECVGYHHFTQKWLTEGSRGGMGLCTKGENLVGGVVWGLLKKN